MAQMSHHHGPPHWIQMWHSLELTASLIGMVLLLLVLAAIAIFGS